VWLLAILALAGGLATGRAQSDKEKAGARAAEQRKEAEKAWTAIDAGPYATLETRHLLLVAPKAQEGKLKAAGALLEKYFEMAVSGLGLDRKKDLPEGLITVYLLADREQVATFARRVETRRPGSGETGSFSAADERLHAVGAPATGKIPVNAETRAGEQLAALLASRKAGVRTPLPDWVLAGFGRATTYRVAPRDAVTVAERKQARALARTRNASTLWAGTVEPEELEALSGSVMDFLAYGPAGRYVGKFLIGFQPGEGAPTKTVEQALTAAGLSGEKIDRAWKGWASK
jgi:hypothetical protein